MVLCDQKKPKNLEVNVVREQHLILKNPKSKVKLNIVIGTKLINWLKHQQHQYKVASIDPYSKYVPQILRKA